MRTYANARNAFKTMCMQLEFEYSKWSEFATSIMHDPIVLAMCFVTSFAHARNLPEAVAVVVPV